MRCLSCNKALSDFESTRKDENEVYLDMCNACFSLSDRNYPVIEREDLDNGEEIEQEVGEDDDVYCW